MAMDKDRIKGSAEPVTRSWKRKARPKRPPARCKTRSAD